MLNTSTLPRRAWVVCYISIHVHAVGVTDWVGLEEAALVRGSLAVYTVPLLGLLAGALFGDFMARQWLVPSADAMSILFGAIGALAFYGLQQAYGLIPVPLVTTSRKLFSGLENQRM